MSYMVWADYQYLASSEFFRITKEIYDLEEIFHKRIECSYMRDSMHNTRRFEYPWVSLLIPPRSCILDVGSGGSSLTAYLASKPIDYYALDYDVNAIEQIKKIKEVFGLSRITPIFCDAKDMSSISSNLFDTTISVSVLEHMDKDDFRRAIDEIVRVTKPNGVIMLTMDISTIKDKDRTDIEDLGWLANKFKFTIPEVIRTTMVNMIQGSDVPFYVACLALRDFK